MPAIYKSAIKANVFGQELVNILYYRPDPDEDAVFSTTSMNNLNQAIVAEVLPAFRAVVPPATLYTGISTVVVNERNETISPFAIDLPISLPGLLSEDTDSVAVYATCAFRVVSPPSSPATQPPKRSYIALGPVTQGQIASNGQLTWAGSIRTAIADALSQVINFNAEAFAPFRVGRAELSEPARWGEVAGVIVRPFVSFRRSRLFTPTGQA